MSPGWYKNFSDDLNGTAVVVFTARWRTEAQHVVFTTPDPNEGVIGGAYEQDIYIGDVVAYDKLAIQPAHKKYLAGWNAEEVVTVDGVSTTNTYTNLTLDEVANWEVKGKITFTAIWKDGFAIQYKEGREEIGVGIFGDFYGDHDHSHDIDGIEGKTLFAHVAPDSPRPPTMA